MHRAAGNLHAVVQRLPLRIEARKRGQQRGMNVQHAVRESPHEMRAQQPHEARQTDQFHLMRPQFFDQQLVVSFALQPLRRDHAHRNAALARDLEPRAHRRDC